MPLPEIAGEFILHRLHGFGRRKQPEGLQLLRRHGEAGMGGLLKRIKTSAEQLPQTARWRLILGAAFRYFLRGKVLGGTERLAEATG